MFLTHFVPMKTPKCYTWLESCGSHLSGDIKEKIFFCILQSVRFSMTVRTDIFLYTEKLSYRNTQWKWGKQWCGTCLRAKQMQNGAREKYWNMENEKSLWCSWQAGQWRNWWRIVNWRLWQKLWTKIFFRWHFQKIHVLTVPIMCPTWQPQCVFFPIWASELKIPLF